MRWMSVIAKLNIVLTWRKQIVSQFDVTIASYHTVQAIALTSWQTGPLCGESNSDYCRDPPHKEKLMQSWNTLIISNKVSNKQFIYQWFDALCIMTRTWHHCYAWELGIGISYHANNLQRLELIRHQNSSPSTNRQTRQDVPLCWIYSLGRSFWSEAYTCTGVYDLLSCITVTS